MEVFSPHLFTTTFRYSSASLIAQLVKNPHAMQETLVRYLDQLGRSSGEVICYPLQYSEVSLVAQIVKNRPAMQETWVWSWVGKISWRRERLPTPVFWPGEFHGLYSPRGHKESDTTERLSSKYSYALDGCFYKQQISMFCGFSPPGLITCLLIEMFSYT